MPRHVLLLIGTKRGLFTARSTGAANASRDDWRLAGPFLAGRQVYHAVADTRDGRDGTLWAATNHKVWGAHLYSSRDGGESWQPTASAPHHPDGRGLTAIWHLAPGPRAEPDTLYAGIQPAGLFVSRDRGASWAPVASLNDHATTARWQPSGGGLALGSVQWDPRDPDRLYCAVSAGGVYRSDDGGDSWKPINTGVRADFLPARTASANSYPEAGQCVHRLRVHPANPDRLYQQNHCGVYRSDNRGEEWVEITRGLPSDFGFALAVDPRDDDVVYTIPEESSHMRATVDGRLRVYRSRDAGGSWEPLTRGLPQKFAYVSVLRDAMDSDGLDPCGLYFGTSGGRLFASADAGESWSEAAGFLPGILSVTAAIV